MSVSTSTKNDLRLSRFLPEHLSQAGSLSQAEGWPHRIEDWKFVLDISQGIVALAGEEVVGTAIATPFGSLGMLNMIIVDPRMRGQSLGRQLVEAANAQFDAAEWRLVATEAGMPLYKKLGFSADSHIAQHHGTLCAGLDAADAEWATSDDLPAIICMDRDATGADRTSLIRALYHAGSIAVIRDGERLLAYGARRAFGRGEVAGPVIARDMAQAKAILGQLFSDRAGHFMRVDIPAQCGLGPWLADHGLPMVSSGTAMSRGRAPRPYPQHHIFALAAQALG